MRFTSRIYVRDLDKKMHVLEENCTMSYERINEPMGYLITFTTYGTWLHGNQAVSVRKHYHPPGTELLSANSMLEKAEIATLEDRPFTMNAPKRRIVLEAILAVCHYRSWTAYAVHVRSNHVHAVIAGKMPGERIMNDFKVYSTRSLQRSVGDPLPETLWTRHGSTRYLWTQQELSEAICYVRDQQGKTMAFGQTVTEEI